MGWINEDHEAYRGHEGYLLALAELRPKSGLYRELGYSSKDETEQSIALVVVACDCGWRSPRLVAPHGTRYAPYIVVVPDACEGFEDFGRFLWRRHLREIQTEPFGPGSWSEQGGGYVGAYSLRSFKGPLVMPAPIDAETLNGLRAWPYRAGYVLATVQNIAKRIDETEIPAGTTKRELMAERDHLRKLVGEIREQSQRLLDAVSAADAEGTHEGR